MKNLNRVTSFVEKTPWAILPEKLDAILEVIRLKAAGADVPYQAVERPQTPHPQSIAVLPLFGLISQRMNILTKFSGGTSTELFAQEFRRLIADPQISAVVIEVDSPGGGVNGVPELAQEIYRSRGRKPIVAVANAMNASAAYWISTAAERARRDTLGARRIDRDPGGLSRYFRARGERRRYTQDF